MAPHRDSTLILLAYRHGLRASELVATRWDQLDFGQGLFHVRRLKNGIDPSLTWAWGGWFHLRARRLSAKNPP